MKAKIKVPTPAVFKDFGIMRLPSGTYICPGWIKVPNGTTREDCDFEFTRNMRKRILL